MRGNQYLGYRPSQERIKEYAKKLIDEGKTTIKIKSDGSIDYTDEIVDLDYCECGHSKIQHSVSGDGREITWCSKPTCACKKFSINSR